MSRRQWAKWFRLLLLMLCGEALAWGISLRHDPAAPGWTPWAIQGLALIVAVILMTNLMMEDISMNEPNPQPPELPEVPVAHPFLEEGESLENPDDPITLHERLHLYYMGQKMPGRRWFDDTGVSGSSWRLFAFTNDTDHGYQIVKAPMHSTTFAPYYPKPMEADYIVSSLNAVPRYEALVRQLEARIAELETQVLGEILTTRIRQPAPGEGDNAPEIFRARAREEITGEGPSDE